MLTFNSHFKKLKQHLVLEIKAKKKNDSHNIVDVALE